jgi:glutamate N-acetyltransferase/amino-acid N-acetyltransferase
MGKGFIAGGISAGLKKNRSLDIGLLVSTVSASVAGVFTRNQVKAAPVRLSMERVASGTCRAILVNSGNANCCTGPRGDADARAMGRAAATALAVPETSVLVASTGVIGHPLQVSSIEAVMPDLVDRLSPEAIEDLARAIMTTDTVPKWRSIRVDGEKGSYTVTAVAKGAGMIRPDLATMLCFVATDAAATPATLRSALTQGVDRSFNRITIDGDTSTNDTVLLMANGLSGVCVDDGDPRGQFQAAVDDLLIEMARWIVRDGEGVSKVVDVRVLGAPDSGGAYRVADAVAHSPLVKTAFFGEDANWGRILAAAGRAGVAFDPDAVDLYFDDVQMVRSGAGCGPAAEAAATAVMKRPAFSVTLDLHAGKGASTLITGDFSLDYVRINADYRS